MKAPATYAEWLALLDRFRQGDDCVLEPMRLGRLEWTSVVAERWTRQIASALSDRIDSLSQLLQKALDRAGDDCFAVANALLAARRGLVPLRALTGLPAAPAEVRAHLAGELDRWVADVQRTLERCATTTGHHDQGRMLKTIRDNSLASANGGSTPEDGRRIITGEVQDA